MGSWVSPPVCNLGTAAVAAEGISDADESEFEVQTIMTVVSQKMELYIGKYGYKQHFPLFMRSRAKGTGLILVLLEKYA